MTAIASASFREKLGDLAVNLLLLLLPLTTM